MAKFTPPSEVVPSEVFSEASQYAISAESSGDEQASVCSDQTMPLFEQLQDHVGQTFIEADHPLTGLSIALREILDADSREGQMMHAMWRVYAHYYGKRVVTLEKMGETYVPPPSAPYAVRRLFADAGEYIFQSTLEAAMDAAVEHSARFFRRRAARDFKLFRATRPLGAAAAA